MPDRADLSPDAAALERALGIPVVVHAVVDSTMRAAREDAGPIPAIHLAERQTAGRGRLGRGWSSPPGNLYATIAWPDPGGAWPPALLAAIQLAWSEAIETAGGPKTRVKWPNDGWLGDAKWAGAMAERQGDRLLVGLGANLEAAPADLPPGSPSAIALAARWPGWPGRAAVAELLLDRALEVLRGGSESLAERLAGWPGRDLLAPGEVIRVETPGGELEGRYRGVAPDGRLRLATDEGEVLVAAGDARRLRTG